MWPFEARSLVLKKLAMHLDGQDLGTIGKIRAEGCPAS